MAFNIMDLMNATTKAAAGENNEYQEITLGIRDIVVTKHNKYSMDGLKDLAAGIEMDGLQEPLVLGQINGEYWLISGHRRMAALNILVAEGKEAFETVKCRYKQMTETEFRIALLVGNTFNRKMTDYDLMTQAAEWKEVLTQARKEGLLILEAGERVRDYVAAAMGETVPKIRDLNTIDGNATQEVKEQFQKGNMGITAALEASKADEETQKEIAQASESKGGVGAEEIRAMTEEKKGRKTKEEETREANVSDTDTTEEENAQASESKGGVGAEEIRAMTEEKKGRKTKEEETREANVSDTDTTEEEKENARKLHAVKMIEKYYTWLNEEEVGILEAMLEDCKRRKREYAIEEA